MDGDGGWSSMFLDLDKPVLKDPREVMEAAMEWDAISEMYAQRDETRKRTGFLKDLHEEKGFTLNPDTGRYRDVPGFNPPRRIESMDYESVPMEVRDMILDRVGGFKERTLTRMVSRSHACITKNLDEVLYDVIEDTLRETPQPGPIEEGLSKRIWVRRLKIWMDQVLYKLFDMVFKKLAIPLIVVPSREDFETSSIAIAFGDLLHALTREYEHELMLTCVKRLGLMGIQATYCRMHSDNPADPKGMWTHYPVIRRVLEMIFIRVNLITHLELDDPDEKYELFKRKMLKRAS